MFTDVARQVRLFKFKSCPETESNMFSQSLLSVDLYFQSVFLTFWNRIIQWDYFIH